MGYFKYRDVVPLLNQTVITCLPNAQNNAEQVELYDAFSAGDVSRVLSYSRDERKQLFVTAVSVGYAGSLAKAEFSDISKATVGQSRSGKKKSGLSDRMGGRFGTLGGRFGGRFGGRRFLPQMGRRPAARKADKSDTTTENDGPGFLVVMEGYSPYRNINELLDPPGVGNDQSKWGLVTRFENLAKLMPNSMFELFEKNNIAHFKCETGEVEIGSANMPGGIGVERDVERIPKEEESTVRGGRLKSRVSLFGDYVDIEKVLVDPMTNEEMSKTFDLVTREEIDSDPSKSERDLGKKKYTDFGQPRYIVKDHWFRVKAKFLWKGAPKAQSASTPSVVTYRKR